MQYGFVSCTFCRNLYFVNAKLERSFTPSKSLTVFAWRFKYSRGASTLRVALQLFAWRFNSSRGASTLRVALQVFAWRFKSSRGAPSPFSSLWQHRFQSCDEQRTYNSLILILHLKRGYSPFCASVLLITKGRLPNINIAQISHFSNFFESDLYSFTSTASQNSVRYLVSKSYLTNVAVQNVNKAFVYITDCNLSLMININNPKVKTKVMIERSMIMLFTNWNRLFKLVSVVRCKACGNEHF